MFDADTIQIALAVLSLVVGTIWTVLKIVMNAAAKERAIFHRFIDEKFEWAEAQRQESSRYWEKHFELLSDRQREAGLRADALELRIRTIELSARKTHDPPSFRPK